MSRRLRAAAALAGSAALVAIAGPAEAATAVSGALRTNTYSCTLDFAGRGVTGTCAVHDGEYDGLGVYLQIKGVRSHGFDQDWTRLTTNVPGGYPVTAYYSIDFSTVPNPQKIDTWKIRVCLEVRFEDDPCGGTSSVNI